MTIFEPLDRVEHFRARVLQDALNSGLAVTYRRRADALEAARPRPGDFTGRATVAELEERHRLLTERAEACRRHATLLLDRPGVIDPDVVDALREVS